MKTIVCEPEKASDMLANGYFLNVNSDKRSIFNE